MEEFQRKCSHHVRRPLSKAALDEYLSTDAEKERTAQGDETDGKDGGQKDNRDWKRAGTSTFVYVLRHLFIVVLDERWLENLDSKMALLISRDEVDPRTYGGKSYEE